SPGTSGSSSTSGTWTTAPPRSTCGSSGAPRGSCSPVTGCTGSFSAMAEKAEVSLRDFRPGDAEAVHRWFNDERVTADLVGRRDSFTRDGAGGPVERAHATSSDRKWAITIDGADGAVGFVALFGLDRQ